MNHDINLLLTYGLREKLLDPLDYEYALNQIMHLLGLASFEKEEIQEEIDFFRFMPLLLEKAFNKGLIPSQSISDFDHFEGKLMDALLPRPAEIDRRFRQLYKQAPIYATNDFYHLSQKSNYIKTERIKKNIHFIYEGKYAPLDLSINLSKPEKDPLVIAQANQLKEEEYPKCALCMENVGFYGNDFHPSRSNHRVVTLTLNREKNEWGLQYSPYSYFNEHLIVLKKEHSPMDLDVHTFYELVDFVNQFSHYTIGSNAGLPIVGGSILNHYHFQGGKTIFPMESARVLRAFKVKRMMVEILDWPMNVIRVSGSDEYKVIDLVEEIFEAWKKYSNPSLNILAETEGGEHNTITPIVKIHEAKYQFYIVLRNNLTTKERPYGLYHPRDEYFHIKKENIGLIEVMGLAILPGRLKTELDEIKEVLLHGKSVSDYPNLKKHAPWIKELKKKTFDRDNIDVFLQNQVGEIFEKVLEDCGVFKPENRMEFYRFVEDSVH